MRWPRSWHPYMFDKFHDECGVFAIYGHPEAANLAYLGLYAMQHRGQESAGIASSDGRHIHNHKSMGHVADIFTPEVLGTLPGELAIGHTRYSTAGDTVLLNAQPFSVACNKGQVAVAHNGNITNAAELRRDLEREGSIFQASSDTEVILHLVARSRERTLPGALREALLQLEGAFSLVFLAEDRIIIARDPHGFRPLAFGQMELSGGSICHVFASETCAFDLINAVYLGDVEPGEMVIVSKDGMTRERYAPVRSHSHCVFEHVYFSRPDSFVFGRPVEESREQLGRLLAQEHGVEADIVVPVPDSGVAAALGYSSESGIPFRQALIRNHYVGRTFIEPSQAIRDFGVKLKLNPVRHLLEGKRVVLVDDSLVRGTTSRKIVRMVRGAGAREVHLRISCPPTISPCFYGVDTPSVAELIAANNTVEEIRRFVEADSLGYLSIGGLREAVADRNHDYCYACYTGNYPTELVNIQELMSAKDRRG
jgi:amidophosphoribosyltransferase